MRTPATLTGLGVVFALLMSLSMTPPARADVDPDLDVTTYVELTIERLELIHDAWSDTGAPPSEEKLSELYESYGVDSQEYLRYGGKKRKEIQRYLDEHDKARGVIESLSAAIHALIEEEEPE